MSRKHEYIDRLAMIAAIAGDGKKRIEGLRLDLIIRIISNMNPCTDDGGSERSARYMKHESLDCEANRDLIRLKIW